MRRFPFAIAGFAALLFPLSLASQTAPDFRKARDEAVQTLQALVRLDTSNPPGNETKVAQYLKSILDKEGVVSEIVALEPARGNLIARIKGNGRKKPLLLMGHTDVVGVERDKWTVDPFAGIIQDGFVYGRGTRDDKDSVAAMLQVFLLIHRQKLPLDRDIIFLAEAGEEGTTNVGIDFVIENHWPKIESEFALSEGGGVRLHNGKVHYMSVGTGSKVPRRLRLVARGLSGHGSVPRLDNPILRLAAALTKVGEYQPPMRLNETTRVFFQRLARISSPEEAFLFTHLEDPSVGPLVQETLRRSQNRTLLTYNSMLRTSITPTIIQGGFRNNVIPGDAVATLDVRALADEDVDQFIAELRRIINDPAIEIVRDPIYRPVSKPSSLDSEMFRALEKTQATVFPGSVTLPAMGTGVGDSSQLRAKGVLAYGVGPPGTDEDAEGSHGNDERVSIEAVGQFVEFIYRAVMDVAATR